MPSVNRKRFLGSGQPRPRLASSCLALSLVTTLAWAQEPVPMPPPPTAPLGGIGVEAIAPMFDFSQEQGSLQVGKKGKAKRADKHAYGVKRNRTEQQLEVTLEEKGKASKFSYNEGQGTVTVMLGGQTLQIAIQKDQVQVGTMSCPFDAECIANAVREALPGLTAEEVAAALVTLDTDLAGMKHGRRIQQVMGMLAATLADLQGNL